MGRVTKLSRDGRVVGYKGFGGEQLGVCERDCERRLFPDRGLRAEGRGQGRPGEALEDARR